MREAQFSTDRAVESILFLAARLKNPTVHEILKLLYFADKAHLEKYGCMALGDQYCAMEFGPVASQTYDLMKAARGIRNRWTCDDYVEAVKNAISITGHHVRALREPRLDYLSTSHLNCLESAASEFSGLGFEQRTKISHDDAYERAWAAAAAMGSEQSPMSVPSIAKTLPNAGEVLSYIES